MAKNDANQGGLIRKNTEYDEYAGFENRSVSTDPGIQVLTANEEPTGDEMAHYHDMYAEFMAALYDNNARSVEQVIGSSEQLYEGVSEAAMLLLRPVYQRHEQKVGEVPQAVMFGEGGMIHTAVEEVFQYAQAVGIEGSQDQDQYTAAHVDMMRKVGEYIESKSDDDAVEEAQDLLVDVEMSHGLAANPEVSPEDRQALEEIAAQQTAGAEEEPLPPDGAPVPGAPPADIPGEGPEGMMAPESGGLV